MTTPQDIIRAWCASCGMAEPSNGECMALEKALIKPWPASEMSDTTMLVSAYRLAATLQGEQSLVVMELANRFARLTKNAAGGAA